MITSGSTSLWLVLEALGPATQESVERAAKQLTRVISSVCPSAEIATSYLDRSELNRLA